jgi:hypothetical protein
MTRHRWLLLLGAVSAGALLTVAAVPPVSPQNVLGECALTFDHPAALGAISDQAAGTFAPYYRMPCSSHSLNVESATYPHFHLLFEDPTIGDCFVEADGITGLGREIGGECVAPDWDHEPRYLAPHTADKWIRIWMEDGSSHQPRAFDLRRIHVGSGASIQLWYQTQNGDWWFWSGLKGGKNWKLEQWSKDVMEVRIRGSSGASGVYTIHNAYIHQ